MATTANNQIPDFYVNWAGLQLNTALILEQVDAKDAAAIKTILFDETTREIKYYTELQGSITEATVPKYKVTLPKEQDLSGLMEKLSEGTPGNIPVINEDGETIGDAGVALAELAKLSDIEAVEEKIGDISTLKTTAKSDVVSAVNELKDALSNTADADKVTLTEDSTNPDYAKVYTLSQGGNAVGTINIPKDMVVSSGQVVVDPEGQEPGTYLELVLANADADKIYINATSFIDNYKATQNATQIQLAINAETREISASIVAGGVGTTELADNAITTVKIADGNVTYAKLAADVIAAFDTAGAANTAEQNAKKHATDLNTAMDARVKAVEEKVGDGLTPVTEDMIRGMFNQSQG